MKFSIKYISKCSGRLGIVSNIERLPDLTLETPFLLFHTKGGSVPHLGREVFDYLTKEKHGVQICVSSTEHMEEALKVYGNDIGSYCGMEDQLTFVTLKDPAEICPTGYHGKGNVPIFAKSGKVRITPERYMNIIEAFKPDFYHALCDGDSYLDCSNKRLSKSVEKTEEFLQICVDRHKKSDILKNSMLLGVIEGGYSEKLREISIKNVLEHDILIGGMLIDGLHTNGPDVSKLNMEKLKNIVGYCQTLLPSEKLKLMFGAYNPVCLLHMIRLGIDIFDTTYPYIQATNNLALTFNFDLTKNDNIFNLNLSEAIYKNDFTPILNDCQCLACQKHTKAYIYHLIDTKELLAPILLMIHNLHHYLEYFKIIRQCIANDKLQDLIDLMQSQLK